MVQVMSHHHHAMRKQQLHLRNEAHGGANRHSIDPPMRNAASHDNASTLLPGEDPGHNSTAEDGTIVGNVLISIKETVASGQANSSQQQSFFVALVVAYYVGMAMAVFAPLAVGKTGLDFLQPFFGVVKFAIVDLATAINNEPPLAAVPSTSESNIEKKSPNAQCAGSPSGYCKALLPFFGALDSSRSMLVPFGSRRSRYSPPISCSSLSATFFLSEG